MPKSVNLTNLNPSSEFPIYRFQVVEHTANDRPAIANGPAMCDIKMNGIETTTKDHVLPRSQSDQRTASVSQSIASMHQRATELLNRLSEHRGSKQSQRHYRRHHHTLDSSSSFREAPNKTHQITETHIYLDSGGSVHGPMDQKHSTRLGNISRSGQLIPGSRHYLSNGSAGWSHERDVMRHQSDSGAWDARSENISRGRTYSESRRPFLSERTHEHSSSSSRYYAYQQQQTYPQHHFKTTASHQVGTHSPSTHISRWSSMQGMGTSGTWRGSSGNRYATTLTRQHIKRHRDPVEMLVKHPVLIFTGHRGLPSMGASKVDLVSIDTRRGSSPPLHYSPNTYSYRQFETESITERERRLRDELVNTQRELQELKRSRSLTGDLNLISSSTAKENLKSTSTQYLNESSWTTHTLKK
ncbi:uncharacterized protein DEA37_0003992 [Paragonimus westermani]|uniref:Uncharacterized protein n=1 Tax=Paragonimus westermani TaxID=34504 RepID=A0A5J4NMP2_9TREM|nr:uncharacterized protein DEA37_0003992 [Paragonimus westermani]